MKTPEQIAREAYGQEPGNGWAVGSSEIVPMIIAAIEADREQMREYVQNLRNEIRYLAGMED